MKRSWTALAVALAAIFAAIGCNDYGNTFQNPTGATITALSPSTIPAGSPQFTLTVIGGTYVAQTVVQWNQQTIATQVLTDSAGNVTGITATVPASLVAKPGTATVNTLSPHSGAGTNGLSNTLNFIISPAGNPLPTISSTSPACAVAGSAAFTMTVTGTNFVSGSTAATSSQVLWAAGGTGTQTTLATVVASATQMQATVPSNLVAATGTASVSVFNPPASGSGGGGTSQTPATFTIALTSCPATAARTTAAMQTAAAETPAVSTEGRYVAYTATQGTHAQVFVRDTCQGVTTACQTRTLLVSAAADGTAGNEDSGSPSMSSGGRYVAFSSAATNLLADAQSGRQVYLRDTCLGADASCAPSTQLVSTDPQGALVGTEAILPSVSASGRFVAFVAVTPSQASSNAATSAPNSATATTNSGLRQVFVRDTCLATSNCTPSTTRISLQPGDATVMGTKPAGPALSGSGTNVAIPDAGSTTILSRAVTVDDRVFLAITGKQ
jgi:hypothetical protein